MKFYSNPNRSVQRCLNLLFQNQLPLFLLHTFFRTISHEFSLKPVYSPSMVKKTFQIYGIQIHIKCICKSKIECRHFYSPLHSPQTASFRKHVSPTSGKGEGGRNYDLLYLSSFRQYQNYLE